MSRRYAHHCRDDVLVSAAAARALVPLLRREVARIRRDGQPSPVLVELVEVCESAESASERRSVEVVDVEDPAPSPHDEIDSDEAAEMLDVTPDRVTQLLRAGRLTGRQRRKGGAWIVDRWSVVAYGEERSA